MTSNTAVTAMVNSLQTFNGISSEILSQATSYLESVKQWAQQNTQHAVITAVAFTALGIIMITVTVTVTASVTHVALIGMGALFVFGLSAAVGYRIIKQAISSVRAHTAIQIENVQGAPPSLATPEARRIYLKDTIMPQTIRHVEEGFYISPNGTRHTLDARPAVEGTEEVPTAGAVHQRAGNETTRIVVRNQDCLEAAAVLHARGLNPIVLDMANAEQPGGNYRGGAASQEEDCCRRTTLSFAIDPDRGMQPRNFYRPPLNSSSQRCGLYVPHVSVFRAGFDKGYQYLNHPFEVAFGVFAAVFVSSLVRTNPTRPRLTHMDAERNKESIRAFFNIAHQKGHQSVVFSAFGCGAFGNPPDQIAEITMQVLRDEFANCFKEVVIAIVEDINSHRSHNREGNFRPFARHAIEAGGKVYDANGNELTEV